MRYYDDLIEESFLLLRTPEQILSMNSAFAVQVVSEPALAFDYRISPDGALQILTSDSPLLYVPEGVLLALNDTLQLLSSYRATPAYDPILDEATGVITDLDSGIITDLATGTDIELLRDRGITILSALQLILDTDMAANVFGAQIISMNDALQQMLSYVDPYYDPILDEAFAEITDLDGGTITSLLLLDVLRLSVSYAMVAADAIQNVIDTTPVLSKATNLLINNASQLLPTTQVDFAAAILMVISDALQQQVASQIGMTFEHSLVPGLAIQTQIVDAITASAAHNILAGNSLNEIKDDTAYLAGAMSTVIADSLQTLTSDTLTTRYVANLLADNTLHTLSDADIVCHAAYALILNTANQIVSSDGALIQLEATLLALSDALQQVTTISPTLAGVMSLLINDSQHLTIADNAYAAREFMMALSDSLHQLAADNIDFVTAEIILLALEDALQAVSTVEPRITSEALVALVRDVLARGYYFFKARTKTKR